MNEPTQQQPTELEALRTEIATLRQVNSELVAKNGKRKDRVTELEAALAERDGQLASVNSRLKAIEIDTPLKTMAKSLSVDAPLFLDTFNRTYDVQLVDGALALRDKEGDVVRDKAGNEVRFEREALLKHLSDDKHQHHNFYSRILIASKASGAGTTSQTGRVSSSKKPTAHRFGLR